MPNMKNAKKRVKQIAKQKVINNDQRASMRTAIKKVDNAVAANNKTDAMNNLSAAIKKIDKAGAKGVIHKNSVARNKSRLTKKVNAME